VLWTPSQPSLTKGPYGCGFGVRGEPGKRIVGHNGGFAGISALLQIYLDEGWTVAVLSNYDQAAITVGDRIGELIARVQK
jgi:hypothetical protein